MAPCACWSRPALAHTLSWYWRACHRNSRIVSEASRAAFAALSDADKAEAAADRKRRREEFAVKREAKRKLRLAISAMILDGDTPAEISSKTGLSAQLFHASAKAGLFL
jgi:hypothetical protein